MKRSIKNTLFSATIALLLLNGCSLTKPNDPCGDSFNTHPCEGVLGSAPYLKKKEMNNEKAYSDEYKAISEKVYLYAQMAMNSYETYSEQFELPTNIKKVESIEPGWYSGLYAQVYEIKKMNGLKEVVIAFRGSEKKVNDWVLGNILPIQYISAEDLYAEVKSRPQYKNIKIVATGHSLGGGLALHLSELYDGVDAIAFNPSPFTHTSGQVKKNRRTVIIEKGDVLEPLRKFFGNSNYKPYDEFYCNNICDHSMYLLARCVTHVAAINSVEAEISLRKNIFKRCELSQSQIQK